MRSLSVRLLLSLLVLVPASVVSAHDVTLSGTQSFASLDGSSNDHDGSVNGVFTVSDGNLVVNGVVNCNDDGPGGNSACAMVFSVSGDLTVNAGGALYAENRSGAGNGGPITLNVGGDLTLNGNAIVSSASKSNSSNANGGAIGAIVNGNVTIGATATVDAGTPGGTAGNVTITAGGVVAVHGAVLSGPSRTLAATRLIGTALTGGSGSQRGGQISISSTTFVEPAIVVSATANIVSQGETATGAITLDGCGLDVRGLVASISRDSASVVTLRSGKGVVVDGRDLGATGNRMGRVRADAITGTAAANQVDLFAADGVTILGPVTGLFAVTANGGTNDPKSEGGTVRAIALAGSASASGNAIAAGGSNTGNGGGRISIASAGDALLNTASLSAAGDHASKNAHRDGGLIEVRSYNGNVIWTNGSGDVRPVGSNSNLPTADQGSIVLTACGTVNTTGSTFPVNGVATSVHPQVQTGVCAPAAPSLPAGVPPLVTCNTPPVANDATASTNEDTSVTITLSGSDADGDSLTFSIVSGPAHGTLGPIVSTGPTTATVNYTPALNYNGSDSFVYQANDGNGGTDTANVAITIVPVNDAPSFLAGATVTVSEDAGAQTFAGWASSISAGPADEAGQTVTFSVSNNNNALFAVQPAVASNGTLTFTPAPNAYGSATITIVAQDNGGTANGGVDTSAAQTSTITVNAVNDEPSFVAGGNQTVNEDAGAQSVSGWATAISAGPNESQTLTFVVTANSNAALFSVQPSVASNGTLTYTPAADANGSATITLVLQDDGGTANGGDDTSAAQSFTITVNAVNDTPSFTSGGDVTVNEDSGAYSATWATAISAGPADENGQTLTFSVSNDNNALFSAQPSLSSSGVLTFTPAANAFGSATITVTLSDNGGGSNTSAPQTFTITVNGVNDAPSFTAGGNVSVNEDSGAYSAAWASSISAGAGETQTLTFNVSNDNNALFASQPAISASGVLTFTPAADANGSATVTVSLQDDGGTANGGVDSSASVTFTIVINAVNDAPSFVSGGDVSVNEDSGAYSAAWATGVSAGPSNESSQSVTFFVSGNSNPSLFSVAPSVSPAGALSFTVAPNVFGSATITVYAKDDGGVALGGVDQSAAQSFTINVNGVNDAPSFTAGGNVTVNEDSGVYSAAWASAISAGAGESGQTVTFTTTNSNNALFSAQPSISAAGVLTFTPAANAFGTATVSVFAQDNGGTANGGVDTSATVTFTITVNGVNDPPSAGNDSWETVGNTELRVDVGAGTTPHILVATSGGNGVLGNDADAIEGDPFSITGVVGCADTTAPYDCSVTGGTVSLNANGTFSLQPAPGATSVSFQYNVTDAPAAGAPATATGTVTIVIKGMIWYVNGSAPAGGNGTSSSPFNSFGPLNTAGDPDSANQKIFVHNSTINGNIELEAGQTLHGEGTVLTVSNINSVPSTVLVPAGTRPKVFSVGDTVTVPSGGAIYGIELNSSAGNGVDITTAFLSPATLTTITSTVINAATEGIDINGGSASGTEVRTLSNAIVATGNGIDATATVGPLVLSFAGTQITSVGATGLRVEALAPATVTLTGLSNMSISGTTAGDGIRIINARFDADATTAAFDAVNTAAITIGASADPVGGAAMNLTGVSGNLAFGTLTAHGTSSGVTIAGTALFSGSAGMQVSAGGGAVSASAGPGLSVTNSTIGSSNLTLTSVSSTGGVNGILLSNTGTAGGLVVSGTGAANSGGTISGATGDGVSLLSTANVSLGWMSIHQSRGSGIYADGVSGFSLANSTVTASDFDNVGVADAGIRFGEVSGSASISGTTISGTNGDTIRLSPSSAVLNQLSISNSTIGPNPVGTGGSGLVLQASGTSSTKITVTGSSFTGNQGSGFLTAINANASADLTVTGSTFTGNRIGIDFGTGLNGDQRFLVTNNTFLNHALNAVNLVSGTDTTNASQFVGTIANNQIGNGAPDSGSVSSYGIAVDMRGDSDSIFAIQSNNIRNTDLEGVFVQSRLDNDADAETGRLDLTLTGNTVGAPDDNSAFPFGFMYGVRIESRNTTRLYLNVSANSVGSVGGAEHFRVRQRDVSSFHLERFTGIGTSTAAVASFVAGENAGGSTASATLSTAFTGVSSGTTRTP